MMNLKLFYVEDYGAVGDGVTDDGIAISSAVAAATADPSLHKKVCLKKDTVYRVESVLDNVNASLFSLMDCQNMTIHGNNTTLLMKSPLKIASVIRCDNIEITGLVIDYSPKPYVLGRVIAINAEAGMVDFITQNELGFEGDYFQAPDPFFAFPNTEKKRYHYFITAYEYLNTPNHYRMHIREDFRYRIHDVQMDDEFILPYVGASHQNGGAFLFTRNRDFRMSDCTILSLPEFGFDVRNNIGKGYFKNVRFIPDEKTGIKLVSWRDGFHVKDNLDQIVWDQCYIGPLGDDAFNLSCVQLDIQSIDDDGMTIHALPAEAGNTRELVAGDEYVAYAIETCEYFGEGKIAQVFESEQDVHVQLDKPLPGLKPGMQLSIYRYANQGYIIKDCYIEGTVRARGSGTFLNNTFNVFWVRVENEFFVEGPVPKDILFKDCTFTTFYDDNAEIFHVGTLGKAGTQQCEYKCKNIVLDHCSFLKGKVQVDDGNELIIQ